jgi:rubrerythrin
MKPFETIDEILDFAISEEEKAYAFYLDWAARMERPAMREAFEDFAREELGHKERLLALKARDELIAPGKSVASLHIAPIVEEAQPSGDMDYQEALVVAMKAEQRAFDMYTSLATVATEGAAKEAFASLAGEEAKHRLRFEKEYEDIYMREN